MDINELKKMLQSSTAVLIMDNGEPSFVVVGYDTYRELVSKNPSRPARAEAEEQEIKVRADHSPTPVKTPASGELELLERINKDILALKAQIEDEEKALEPIAR